MNHSGLKSLIKKWAGIVCLLILSLIVTGCILKQQKDQEKAAGEQDMAQQYVTDEEGNIIEQTVTGEEENASEQSTTEAPTTAISDYDTFSNEKYAWWFKRDTEHGQSGCQEDFDIRQYNAYYVSPDSTSKVIYLTFDCGYENGFSPSILDTLKEENVKAAFFVTQTFIRDNVELAKRMKEEGHLVCNHTVHHPSLPDLSVDEVKQELLECQEYMKEATGYDMDLYVRPPKGEYSQRTLQASKDLGYKTIFWSIAYLDYDVNNQPGAGYVVEHFRKYYHPGAIVLMHNVSSANAQALPEVIQLLKAEGYTFGTLDELP